METASVDAVAVAERTLPPLLLVLGAAACYTASMAAMKLWGQAPGLIIAMVIAVTVVLGVMMEILALRDARLGMVYVAILGAECVMMAALCHFGFGESLSGREAAGASLIVIGTALAWT